MRRTQLTRFIEQLAPRSVAIIPGAREKVRSNDTHYRFRQNSDLLYLTGFDEPDSIAVLSNVPDRAGFILFVRPRDPAREIWDGRRAGVEGAIKTFGADEAFSVAELDAKLFEIVNGAENLYYQLAGGQPELDAVVLKHLERMRPGGRRGVVAPVKIVDPSSIVHEMRSIKSKPEIELMQRAATIAGDAHIKAMMSIEPGMKEYELEALIEYNFRIGGATGPAYTSIVGGGANATILHYINNDGELRDGDLVLVDAGAEYQGYASDITRTFPINGHFTEAQSEVYQAVLDVQLHCISMARAGTTIEDLKNASITMLTDKMIDLGLLQGRREQLIADDKYKQFYMHGLGHYLGLDVHDVGRYEVDGAPRPLEPGMVITVEPGLYIAAGTEGIPEKYCGIGVRIEDDVVITDGDPLVLTAAVPKEIGDIERKMFEGQVEKIC